MHISKTEKFVIFFPIRGPLKRPFCFFLSVSSTSIVEELKMIDVS